MQEYIPFFQAEKRSIAEKLAKYFEYSGLEAKIHFDEEKDAYILSVPSKKEKEAKKFYQAFYFVERDRIEDQEKNPDSLEEYDESNILSATPGEGVSESSLDISNEEIASADMDGLNRNIASDTDEASEVSATNETTDNDTTSNHEELHPEDIMSDEDSISDKDNISDENIMSDEDTVEKAAEDLDDTLNDLDNGQKERVKSLLSASGSYVMKEEKYKDYIGTQFVFIVLGIAGIIFVFLNAIEVLTLLYGLFPNLIMGALFVFFIYVGLSTGKKAKLLKQEIEGENQLTDKINKWLHTTVTDEFLASITNSELSEELDYIKKTDTIRDMINKEFGEQNRDYLDRLIEEFYTETFDASNSYIEKEVK